MLRSLKFWSSNFLVQVSSKLLSFVSNQLLVRLLCPSLFGVLSVRLALITETIVFWSRDGIRKAASRSSNPKRYAALPVIIGLVLSPFFIFLALKSAPDVIGYNYAVIMTIVSAVMELVGELWAVPQNAVMEGSIIAKVTGPAYFTRSISLVVLTNVFHKSDANTLPLMICFGSANLVFGTMIILGFLWRSGKPCVERPTKEEFASLKPFIFQTILQWLFSQGERMVLIMSNTEEQIGIYGFVSDISSIIARLIFAPVESTVFSLCATKDQELQMNIVCIASRFVVTIGLFALAFGPRIAPPVLEIVYSKRWSGDGSKRALSAFCRIMPLMALNGVTEAFANARLTEKSLMKYNILLALVSALYFFLIFYLSKFYDTVGVIMANGVNMLIRSIMAITVIFKERGTQFELFPNFISIILFLTIGVSCSSIALKYVIILVPFMAVFVLYTERKAIKSLFHSVHEKKD